MSLAAAAVAANKHFSSMTDASTMRNSNCLLAEERRLTKTARENSIFLASKTRSTTPVVRGIEGKRESGKLRVHAC